MSEYKIDHAEPLRPGFTVEANAYDGPGGAKASSSLRLYGRGAVNWGESVNEDLLRLLENFSSATPPTSPVHGQIWHKSYLYQRISSDSSVSWRRFNIRTLTWEDITGQVAAASDTAVTYWYDSAKETLYGRYEMKPDAVRWVERAFFNTTAFKNEIPSSYVKIYDAFKKKWVAPEFVEKTSYRAGAGNHVAGSIRFNDTNQTIEYFDGTAWRAIVASNQHGTTTILRLDAGDSNITNVRDPDQSKDAANKNYVDTKIRELREALNESIESNKAGDEVVLKNLTVDTLNVNKNALIKGKLTVQTVLDVNDTQIVNVKAGNQNSHAVNYKQFTDSNTTTVKMIEKQGETIAVVKKAVERLSNSLTNQENTIKVISASNQSAKNGDITIHQGRVYVAVSPGTGLPPGSHWKQIYPPVYA